MVDEVWSKSACNNRLEEIDDWIKEELVNKFVPKYEVIGMNVCQANKSKFLPSIFSTVRSLISFTRSEYGYWITVNRKELLKDAKEIATEIETQLKKSDMDSFRVALNKNY